MLRIRVLVVATLCVVGGLCTSACSNSDSSSDSNTYSTTSSKGDYAEWTLNDGELTAVWNEITSAGAVAKTFDITASCGTPEATYGYRICTVTTASCTNGTEVCNGNPSGDFDIMEVPGVALFVHTDDGMAEDAQLHVGFTKDNATCADDVSGTYTYVRTGLGLDEFFGMYVSDADFQDVVHSDFGFDTTSDTATPMVVYRTGGNGSGVETLTGSTCVDGVRTRGVGGGDIRSMMTESGLFILDLPAGQGGIVSFEVGNAAVLADWENRSLGGISFPDNGDPQPIAVTTGASASDAVTLTATTPDGTQMLDIRPFTNGASTATSPAYPDFGAVPSGYTANTTLQSAYPNPSTFPGMFRVDGALSDSGRVVLGAMKFNNKLIAVGFVYNYRDTSDINPADGQNFDEAGLYNTGNFILFEK